MLGVLTPQIIQWVRTLTLFKQTCAERIRRMDNFLLYNNLNLELHRNYLHTKHNSVGDCNYTYIISGYLSQYYRNSQK